MREECIEVEEPEVYNEFVRDLKKRMMEGALGGDRREMWLAVRSGRVGLIDKRASSRSEVSEGEAREVSCGEVVCRLR